jgi:hypothetical protein
MWLAKEPYFQNALDVGKSCMHACSGTNIRCLVSVAVVRCSYISLEEMNTDYISAYQLWVFTQQEQQRVYFCNSSHIKNKYNWNHTRVFHTGSTVIPEAAKV